MSSQKLILNVVTSVWRSGIFLGVLKKSFAPPYLITSFYIILHLNGTFGTTFKDFYKHIYDTIF